MNVLPEFRTLRPASLAEAVTALTAVGAQVIAGGTDLLPNIRRGIQKPGALVDLTAVPGLSAIEETSDGGLRIGAAATLEAITEHPLILARYPALVEAAKAVAGPTHRAGATLGGNLCQDTRCFYYNQSEWWRHGNGYCRKCDGDRCLVVVKNDRCYATYHGDVAPVLFTLNAGAEIVGPGGTRSLPVSDLFVEDGAAHLVLTPGEIVTAVTIPPASGWRAGYEKMRIRDSIEFALAAVAVALRRDGERLAGLRVAVTGTNSAPLAVDVDELVGRPWDDAAAQRLAALVEKRVNILKTTLVGPRYRRRVLLALARRLAGQLWDAGA